MYTLLAGLFLVSLAIEVSSVPLIKILPLGDSITFGCGSNASPPDWYACCTELDGGYRLPLWVALNGSSINASIAMVGTESTGPLWAPPEAKNHEGHPGWTIKELLSLRQKWVTLNPDIVLLMIGTNDIGQSHQNATVIADMQNLLAVLKSTLPNARLLVTSILNFYSSNNPYLAPSVDVYNAALPSLCNAVGATFVDINKITGLCAPPNDPTRDPLCAVCNGPCGGYNPQVCPPNGYAWCHPSGAGYDLVGGAWASALLPILGEVAAEKAQKL